MATTQAMTLAGNLQHEAAPKKEGEPQVIIPSPLVLTREQELRMLEHFRNRLQTLKNELGRTDYEAPGFYSMPVRDLQRNCSTFMGKRYLSHLIYQQRMEWRSFVLGGLYAESNVHLPITTRAVSQQIARAIKSFFGTSPFFSVSGLSEDEADFAADVNAYARLELDTLGGIGASLQNAIELAFIQGETGVKTRRHKLTSYFESMRVIALDAAGQPIVAQDGDYIYQTDLFVEAMAPQLDANGQQLLDPTTNEPLTAPTGQMVLKRDMETPQPPVMNFKSSKINLTQQLYDRIEARAIYYLDLLIPLTATDVQTADVVFHLYDAQVIEMADKYLRDKWGDTAPKDQLQRIADLVHKILPGSGEEQKSLVNRPRVDQGETNSSGTGEDKDEPTIGLAEGWGWYDPFGDGVQRSIMVLMDHSGRLPVYYDYTANLTEDGLRPIDIVRINPVTGRWHGQGNVERNYSLQEQADLLLNRSLYAESKAARVDFWKPSNTIEGDGNPNLQLNWGGTYRLKENKTLADTLQSVSLPNIKSQNLEQLLQIILQMAQAMSAVSNVNDGAMAGLDTQKLATGIKNLERSGEEMFALWLSHLQPDLESILRRAMKQLLANLQKVGEAGKLMRFFDRPNQRMVEIDPYRMRDLDLDIVLDLTTYKSQAQLQSGQLAFTAMQTYLTMLQAPPEEVQKRLGPILQQILTSLEFKNAKELCAPFQIQPALMPGQPQGMLPTPTAGVPPPETAPAL